MNFWEKEEQTRLSSKHFLMTSFKKKESKKII